MLRILQCEVSHYYHDAFCEISFSMHNDMRLFHNAKLISFLSVGANVLIYCVAGWKLSCLGPFAWKSYFVFQFAENIVVYHIIFGQHYARHSSRQHHTSYLFTAILHPTFPGHIIFSEYFKRVHPVCRVSKLLCDEESAYKLLCRCSFSKESMNINHILFFKH